MVRVVQFLPCFMRWNVPSWIVQLHPALRILQSQSMSRLPAAAVHRTDHVCLTVSHGHIDRSRRASPSTFRWRVTRFNRVLVLPYWCVSQQTDCRHWGDSKSLALVLHDNFPRCSSVVELGECKPRTPYISQQPGTLQRVNLLVLGLCF